MTSTYAVARARCDDKTDRVIDVDAPTSKGLAGAPERLGRRRPTVDPATADAHARRAVELNDSAVVDRVGLHWRPDPGSRRRQPYGREPVTQVRRCFVAKFNPAFEHSDVAIFQRSDPYTAEKLWRMPSACWVSDDPTNARSAPAFGRIAPDDLIFVQRLEPRFEGQTYDDPELDGRPTLVGLWWATAVHRYQHPDVRLRPVTNVWHAPVVRFDDHVDLPTIRRDDTVNRIGAFTDRSRSTLVELSAHDAAVLAEACSLPSWVLTEPDPAKIAARLRTARTGMRSVDRSYRRDARFRHKVRRDVEVAAVDRTEADMVAAGWSVVRKEHVPLWGADLDCERGGLHRAIEVKGRLRDDWANARLERSQYDRARRAAANSDDDWWLFIHPLAASPTPPPYLQFPAAWVSRNWPSQNVNQRARLGQWPALGRSAGE